MRQLFIALFVCSFATAIAIVAIGWSSAEKSGVMTVDCNFAFRETTVGVDEKGPDIELKKITVEIEVNAGDGIEIARVIEPEKLELGNFRVEVLSHPDSLIVRVYDKDAERPITSTLFQIDSSLRNQFVGKHGFSGLNYVYHPKNESELQLWCVKKSFAENKKGD